jgi:hypothetical protein
MGPSDYCCAEPQVLSCAAARHDVLICQAVRWSPGLVGSEWRNRRPLRQLLEKGLVMRISKKGSSMTTMKRCLAASGAGLLATALGTAMLASPASASPGGGHGATKTVNGTYSGTSTGTGTPSGYDGIYPEYTFSIAGSYSDGYLGGHGTYSGTIVLDYNGYTDSNPCATVRGNVTYTSGGGNSGTLTLSVDHTQSTVCETGNSDVHTSHLVENTVVGGTGRLANVTSASITSDGTSDGAGPSYTDSGTLTGTVSF